MELDLGPEIAEYRADLRSWIDEHAPPGLADKADWNRSIVTGGYSASRRMEAMASSEYAQWESACADCCRWQNQAASSCPGRPNHSLASSQLQPSTGPSCSSRRSCTHATNLAS